jgi:hypothetical protein
MTALQNTLNNSKFVLNPEAEAGQTLTISFNWRCNNHNISRNNNINYNNNKIFFQIRPRDIPDERTQQRAVELPHLVKFKFTSIFTPTL